jgi:orotate phosphoribosyltransferase
MAISELYDKDIRYCSNRKEVKDHGDTGILLGSPIVKEDRVILIEDELRQEHLLQRQCQY